MKFVFALLALATSTPALASPCPNLTGQWFCKYTNWVLDSDQYYISQKGTNPVKYSINVNGKSDYIADGRSRTERGDEWWTTYVASCNADKLYVKEKGAAEVLGRFQMNKTYWMTNGKLTIDIDESIAGKKHKEKVICKPL